MIGLYLRYFTLFGRLFSSRVTKNCYTPAARESLAAYHFDLDGTIKLSIVALLYADGPEEPFVTGSMSGSEAYFISSKPWLSSINTLLHVHIIQHSNCLIDSYSRLYLFDTDGEQEDLSLLAGVSIS